MTWRGDKSSTQRGYGYKWQQARSGYLKLHPLCVYCKQIGRVSPATVVDHKIPHRGDMTLFWDKDNWQSLCDTCHSSIKQQEESTGTVRGCDLSGVPVDARHHWNIESRGNR